MTLPRPREIRGKIDENDLNYVRSLGVNPVLAEPCPFGGKGMINPHVTRFHHKDGQVTDVFHIKPVYYETIDHLWRPMSEVTAHHGNRMIVLKQDWAQKMSLRYFKWLMNRQRLFKNSELMIEGYVLQPRHMVFATDTTFYPDPNPESTSVDGKIFKSGTTYSTVRSATNAESVSDSVTYDTVVQNSLSGGTYYLVRSAYLFDTSSIPDSDTINSATFSAWYVDGFNNGNTDSVDLVSISPASNTALAVADYSTVGSTSFGSIALSTISAGAYYNISLNASGIATISKTGVTKLATRNKSDTDNSTPTLLNQFNGRYADYTGTSNDPKLAVTYSSSTTYNQAVTASATMSPSLAKTLTFVKTLSDTIDATVSMVRAMSLFRAISATATATATMLRGSAYAKDVIAVVTATASITSDTVKGVLMTITATGTATLTKLATLSQILSATATGTAVIEAGKFVSKVLAVTATASLVIVKGFIYTAELAVTAIATATIPVMDKVLGRILAVTATAWVKLKESFWVEKYERQNDDYHIKY